MRGRLGGLCPFAVGLLLGFGSVILTKSLMTADQFTAWGWRVFIGFLVAIVGLIIRRRTEDSFVFERHRAKANFSTIQRPMSGATCHSPLCARRW